MKEWSAKPFISHDAADENGVRAEVLVTKGVGKITELKSSGNTTQAHFINDKLKHPIVGWINNEDPILESLTVAFENEIPVEFRVEQQRKAKVDRSEPIKTLRTSMEDAKNNLTKILAGAKVLDGESEFIHSREAVTNPEEDAGSGNGERHSALPKKPNTPVQEVDQPVIRNRSSTFAREEVQWKEYNTDGRLNIGSTTVSASVSAEHVARKALKKAFADNPEKITNESVAWMMNQILQIIDGLQAYAYGNDAMQDRSVQSHVRMRGIVYDTIENYVAFDPTVSVKDWVRLVTQYSRNRVRIILQSVAHELNYEHLPVYLSAPLWVFIPEEPAHPEELASEETIEELKQFVAETEIDDMMHVATLLEVTCGSRRAADIPDETLKALMAFYREEGHEFFNAVSYVLRMKGEVA